jgi:hypothetical protein
MLRILKRTQTFRIFRSHFSYTFRFIYKILTLLQARDCVFLAPALDQASQLKLTEIKEKVGSLERLLERDVAKSTLPTQATPGQESALPDDVDDDLPANQDERDLEVTPLAVEDAAYDVDGDDDDLLDLGIQLGKPCAHGSALFFS